MTLLIGVKCSDGIVLGADSAATLGAMGSFTAQQRTVRKLTMHNGNTIIGVAGSVGVAQRLRATLDDRIGRKAYDGKSTVNALNQMRDSLWSEVMKGEWGVAQLTSTVVGQNALSSANTTMLLAIPLNGKAELVQFDNTMAPELATDELPFVAMGSGQANADPFMGFVRRVFWPKGCPSVSDAIFSVCWALTHAIDTTPNGIGGPVQLMTLTKSGANWVATDLSDGDVLQHQEAIKDAEKTLRDWRSQMTSTASGTSPESPPSPAAR